MVAGRIGVFKLSEVGVMGTQHGGRINVFHDNGLIGEFERSRSIQIDLVLLG